MNLGKSLKPVISGYFFEGIPFLHFHEKVIEGGVGSFEDLIHSGPVYSSINRWFHRHRHEIEYSMGLFSYNKNEESVTHDT